MSLFVVMDTPLSDPDVAPNVYISSEDVDYPSSNLYDLNRRRKMWRSAGYWDVQSGSNTIVFQETIGVNLTATIAVDEYTTDALLFAAIKTALEDAGVGTYSVTRDTTTQKIKITQTVAGGAAVFRLIWTSATAFGAMLGFDIGSNDTGALNYSADLVRIHTSEFIKWDLGIPTLPTCFVAFGDRNAAIPLSPNATIKLQGNHTNSWASPAVDLTLTYRENVLAYIDTDGIGGTTPYRYWRLKIVDQDNPNGYVTLGGVYLGTHVTISRGCPEFPLEVQDDDLTINQETEAGQDLAARRPIRTMPTLNWAKLDIDTMEALHGVWEAYGLHSNFLVAMDIDGVFSSDPYSQVKLVKFANKPVSRLLSPGNFSYAWQLKEAL